MLWSKQRLCLAHVEWRVCVALFARSELFEITISLILQHPVEVQHPIGSGVGKAVGDISQWQLHVIADSTSLTVLINSFDQVINHTAAYC